MSYFYIFGLIALAVVGAIGSCSEEKPDKYKQQIVDYCNRNWKDSGYKWRVANPHKAYINADTLDYDCQVNVNGRWVPERNVKVGG